MYLDPGMQDLSLLPEDPSVPPIGTSDNGVQDSNADFGRRAVEAIVARVRDRVAGFLEHPERYAATAHHVRRIHAAGSRPDRSI
jgi:hypothetical protein